MGKLYFTINKDQTGSLFDRVFEAKSKSNAKDLLRDQGITPKMVFCREDISKIEDGTFQNKEMNDTYRDFVLSHLDEWKKAEE